MEPEVAVDKGDEQAADFVETFWSICSKHFVAVNNRPGGSCSTALFELFFGPVWVDRHEAEVGDLGLALVVAALQHLG